MKNHEGMNGMKLLVIDTSGPVCGVAVMDGDRVLSEQISQNRHTHSANLMPMVDASLFHAGCTLAEMDAVAVVTGPGSFTGVRIGVATARGLAHGSGKPCIGVNALEALSLSAGSFDGVICPIQDARAGQVYGAAFMRGDRLLPDAPMKLEDFLAAAEKAAPGQEGRFLFVGDGAAVHRESIARIMENRAVFLPGYLSILRPSAAGYLAMTKGEGVDYLTLKETYLRLPNAEKNKKLLEAMQHG